MNYRLKKLLVQEREKEKANSQIKKKRRRKTYSQLISLIPLLAEGEVGDLYINPKGKDRNVTVNSLCKENRNSLSMT